jgi:hypothetical protein
LVVSVSGIAASRHPVFQVDASYPTADKPQSKVWFASGSWWALLARKSGPSLWQRADSGWREDQRVTRSFAGLPGRADVWLDRDGATAVAVQNRDFAILRLRYAEGSWEPAVLAKWSLTDGTPVETATIARDASGRWWVAAPVSREVLVWTSLNGVAWSDAIKLADGIHHDDICAVTPLRGGVGVLWSNQQADAVYMRQHRDNEAAEKWAAPETIDTGSRTADDHLNAALTNDDTLWVATKNSVDRDGEPQLVLRVRSRDGRWRNIPYARNEGAKSPSRPVVAVAPDGKTVLFGHSVYDSADRTRDHIVFGRIDLSDVQSLARPTVLIQPAHDLRSRVNDITRPKAAYPEGAPWIVLASDMEGRVYEADVRVVLGVTPRTSGRVRSR